MTQATTSTSPLNHFLALNDIPSADVKHMLEVAFRLREERRAGQANTPVLAGKTLAMLFEKPSLRTRVSFEQGMLELGGNAIILGQNEVGLGKRESVADVTRVLHGMVHGIAARVFDHNTLAEMAAYSDVPVINMLSDASHPAQALADALTIIDEFAVTEERSIDWEALRGRTVTFVGDGNNVARSLAIICGKLGMNFILASPPSYSFEQAFADEVMSLEPTMNLELTHDPQVAVRYADAIYADTFVSMGQEEEKQKRLEIFKGFEINAELLNAAPSHAIVLHCLPAYRGIEITDDAMDGPQSRVFPQAHNRLHAQKGMLAVVMGGC